ncbi:MAG: NADH-quinone oxidoreductase subunit L [Acidimicrobiia bacterium]|nr:NADH-quinone oxidoreductase subunit L [Acidimicrobiia bacterium]
MNVQAIGVFAAEGAAEIVHVSGWFLSNVWIIPAIPAASFFAILFFGKRLPRGGSEVGIIAVGASLVLALCTVGQWISTVNGAHGAAVEPVVNRWTWWVSGGVDFTIGTLVDGLAVALLFVVTAISLLVHIYSTDYVAGDVRYTHFFAFLSLFTAAMLFFVLAENTIQMIVGWELVGVCSFVLIGHWWEHKPNSDAALKAFLTNRVGDIGLLVGVSVLFFAAGGTFSILEINTKAVDGEIGHTLLLISALCLLAAVISKSGQFFLHTWLPDAMAGPTPVSALIHAATMVVAGVYLVARMYGVFFEGMVIAGSSINALALIGGITTLVGASLAFVQNDIKRVLAYSTISQLGYMVMALGVGAWTAAIFHLFTHAFFKACLFLGSGSVSHAVHSFDMKKDMGGLRKHMPHTYRTFLIASLALAGLPPLAGFWSKDEILAGTGGWGVFGGTGGNGAYTAMLVMGMLTAALTAAYMTRCVYLTFFGRYRGHGHPHESGRRITVPLWILAGRTCPRASRSCPRAGPSSSATTSSRCPPSTSISRRSPTPPPAGPWPSSRSWWCWSARVWRSPTTPWWTGGWRRAGRPPSLPTAPPTAGGWRAWATPCWCRSTTWTTSTPASWPRAQPVPSPRVPTGSTSTASTRW